MEFDPSFAVQTIPVIVSFIGTTIFAAIASCFGAASLGFILELGRRSNPVLALINRFVSDFIRCTPILGWLYFTYFVLPFYGLRLSSMTVGILALSIYYSGYLCEVFRAGIDAIPKGQSEAAQALGLRRVDQIAFVLAPQMLRNIAAPLGNYFVSILKATPYLAVIAVPEMLGSAFDIASETYRYAEPLSAAGAVFLLLALLVAQCTALLERRMSRSTNK